jgi:hypothetical protein
MKTELSINQKFRDFYIYEIFFTSLMIGGSSKRKRRGIFVLKATTVLALTLSIVLYSIRDYYAIGLVALYGIAVYTFVFLNKKRVERELIKKGYATIYSFQKQRLKSWIKMQKLYDERSLKCLRNYAEKEFKNGRFANATIAGLMIGIVVSLFDSLKGMAKLIYIKQWEILLTELIPFLILTAIVFVTLFAMVFYYQLKNTEADWMGKCCDLIDDILYQYYQKH